MSITSEMGINTTFNNKMFQSLSRCLNFTVIFLTVTSQYACCYIRNFKSKILVFCNMRFVIVFVTAAEFVFYFYWSWNGRRIRMLDLPDFTDDFVHEQWCIHLSAYSAYVTNKTKKQYFLFAAKCKYRHLFYTSVYWSGETRTGKGVHRSSSSA